MKVLGIRFCKVAKAEEAKALADLLGENGLGLETLNSGQTDGFSGAVFPVDESAKQGLGSWIELWAAGGGMPEMTMLQIVVDDADAFAERARKNGLDVKGPDDARHDDHGGERIYYLEGAGGLPIAFLSKLK